MVTLTCDHDSQELETLLEKADAGWPLNSDSEYVGQDAIIEKCSMSDEVHEKVTKGNPLTEKQKASNRVKSKSRARVEHLFDFMTNSMKAMYVRTIGYVRALAKIGLANLTYNLMRCAQLNKKVYNVFLWR